jgi:hypothetical protein
MTDQTPAQLIAEILQLDTWIDTQSNRFSEFIKPHREKIEALKNQLQDLLNKAQCNSFKTENGTAYLSTITSPSIDGDKTEFLDWVLDNWDERGAGLQIGAPQKAWLTEYMDSHDGQLPPHVKTSSITRVNVRRT